MLEALSHIDPSADLTDGVWTIRTTAPLRSGWEANRGFLIKYWAASAAKPGLPFDVSYYNTQQEDNKKVVEVLYGHDRLERQTSYPKNLGKASETFLLKVSYYPRGWQDPKDHGQGKEGQEDI